MEENITYIIHINNIRLFHKLKEPQQKLWTHITDKLYITSINHNNVLKIHTMMQWSTGKSLFSVK